MLRAVEIDPSQLSTNDRVALLDETFARVRTGVSNEGLLLVGGEEAGLLLAATVDSFRGRGLGSHDSVLSGDL